MMVTKNLISNLFKSTSNAPLIVFRILFGALMVFSTLRFWLNGWIEANYIEPQLHFKYYGFSWVEVLSPNGMYLLFGILFLSALFIMLGFLYRISSILFFLSFTYIEFIDKTYYLNHYYFVSLIALLLIFLPANKRFSLDTLLGISKTEYQCSVWQIGIIKFQLAIVYIFAGIAKINYDWLIRAEPLQNWLYAHHDFPVIGSWMKEKWFAYTMSWSGMFYDLFIVVILSIRKTRFLGYLMVVVFHIFTWLLFPIGVFPWVMIFSTLIFFSANFHEAILNQFSRKKSIASVKHSSNKNILITSILCIYVSFQILFPFRYLLYEGDLFWKEQGYRFSWRVMLMEKAGHATFFVKDEQTGGMIEIRNSDYLTPIQEKMMATQPDLILQYAYFLENKYTDSTLIINNQQYTIKNPSIHAEIYVALNGSGTLPFVKKDINLAVIKNDLSERTWVENFND